MSAIKDGRYPITLDRERHMLCSLNVLDELQDRAGGYDQLREFLYPNGKTNFKNLKWLLALLINEGADEDEEAITETQVGKFIHVGNITAVVSEIFKAFATGMTGGKVTGDDDDDDDDDEKNVMSGQGQ